MISPTRALVCDDFGPEYEASTKTNAPPVGTFVTASISLSQPTITPGNTVEIKGTGWQEPIGTDVQLTLGTVQLGTAKVDRGAISATVTIPAGTQPGDYTVIAKSPNRQGQASLKVLAPSRTGTLTVTWAPSGAVDTNIEENAGPYALSGANFAPGPLTIRPRLADRAPDRVRNRGQATAPSGRSSHSRRPTSAASTARTSWSWSRTAPSRVRSR